jgi:acetyl esterase/lipase
VDLPGIPPHDPPFGRSPFGRPSLGRPPLGPPPFGRPPLGAPPFGGPPPEGFEPPAADVSHIARKWLDIPYAHMSPAQRLDIYLPDTGDGPFLVLFSIHGGAFMMGDKGDVQLTPFLSGLARGHAVVSINYRLSGEAIFPAGLQDTKAAIRWVRAHAAEYKLDPQRIVAWGGSSGANYATMVAVSAKEPLFDDPALGNAGYPCDVALAIDWFGPMDFVTMDEQLAKNGLGPTDHNDDHSPESRYLGGKITDVPEKVRLASPLTYVGDHMPPLLIQHGRVDNLVPFQQSLQLAEAITARVGADRFELDILDGAGHADPMFESDENLERVFDFVERRLK